MFITAIGKKTMAKDSNKSATTSINQAYITIVVAKGCSWFNGWLAGQGLSPAWAHTVSSEAKRRLIQTVNSPKV